MAQIKKCTKNCNKCKGGCYFNDDVTESEKDFADMLDSEILQDRQKIDNTQEYYLQGTISDKKIKLLIVNN